MGRMGAGVEQHGLAAAADLPGDRLELGGRPVLVIGALDDQGRRGDPGQQVLYVPVAEFRGQPDIVPVVEDSR